MEVVVVSVAENKNVYYLSPNSIKLLKNDIVVFESDNGLLIGNVCKETYQEKEKNLVLPLFKVLRKVTSEDLKNNEKNKKLSEKALNDAKTISSSMGLDMSFVDSYFTLDKAQLVLSFVSYDRVDFRDLAKKLAQKYKTRIELRQIGVRDKAKKIGGLGPCGLFLCCNTFLTDFDSVSINMAKNQMLALNPSKINGICGRLLCCLGYENDNYTELKKDLPKIGMSVDTPMGMGKVTSLDVFNHSYYVDLGDQGIVKVSGDVNGNSK